MKTFSDIYTSVLSSTGIIVSIQAQLKDALSIILLIVSIINVVLMCIFRLIDRYKSIDKDNDGNVSKDEKIDFIKDTVKDIVDTSKDVADIIQKSKEDKDNE